MPQNVQMPDGTVVQVPDEATNDQILKFASQYSAAMKGGVPSARAGAQAARPVQAFDIKEAASALPIVGGAIGSVAGPAGTALGAMSGKGYQIAIESMIDPATAEKYSGLNGALRSYTDMALEGMIQGGFHAGTEQAAKAGSWLLGKYAARYARPESFLARKAAQEAGIPLGALEKVGPPITRKEIVETNVTKVLQKSLNDLAPESGALNATQNVADAFQTADANFHAMFSKEYSALDDIARAKGEAGLVSGQTIKSEFEKLIPQAEKELAKKVPETMGAKGFAAGTAKDIEALAKSSKLNIKIGNQTILWDTAPPALKAQLAAEGGKPSVSLSFEEAQLWRSRMLEKAREEGTSEAVAAAKRGSQAIDAAMEETAKNVGIYPQWRELNTAFGDAAQLFDTTFTKAQLKVNPELILDTIKAGRPSQVLRIRDALMKFGGPDGRNAYASLQRGYSERLMSDVTALPSSLDNVGKETLDALYGGTAQGMTMLRNMEKMADVIRQVEKSQPAAYWANLHQGANAGIGFYLHLPIQKLDQGAAWAYTKIAESPIATSILINGLQQAPHSFARFMTNVERALAVATKASRVIDGNNPYTTNLDRVLSFGNAPGPERAQ